MEQKKEEISVKQIIKESEEGKKLEEICEKFHIPFYKLRFILLRDGGKKGEEILSKYYKTNTKNIEKHKIKEKEVPMESIIKDYERGENISTLRKKYASDILTDTTMQRKIDKYLLIKDPKGKIEEKRTIAKKIKKIEKKESKKNKEIKFFDLNMICLYFRIGYNLEQIQKYAKENNYEITPADLANAKKIENGELKIASEESIYKIIKKYGYTYSQLVEIAEKKNYVILSDLYKSVLQRLKNEETTKNLKKYNKNIRKGEER